ncbi:unnamed protein product [Schistocephalus solidus]|uniref:AA_permease domain-containing protein n=1 Tax=Schistocephalus solidus TaxID=70667 RepID=A0A183T7G4_SCHSO|nr:unnamed protein product [Schistocephalus solidus]
MAFAPAIFAIFLLEMRTKAPGAKSFPQFIRRRFGGVAHVLVLVIFVLTSVSNILKILSLWQSMSSAFISSHPSLHNVLRSFTVGGTALNALSDEDCERLTALLMISVGACIMFSHTGSLRIILYFTSALLLISSTTLATMVFDFSQNFPLGGKLHESGKSPLAASRVTCGDRITSNNARQNSRAHDNRYAVEVHAVIQP